MRNYFTFDNTDSRDFGVYISGQGSFSAPARSYDSIPIPHRNGDLLGIEDRLENIEVTYPAFIYNNFDTNIANLRAFLLSHKGYFKLADTYHPNEYRLAYYRGEFQPVVDKNNRAGKFDITFVCKPQRFLNSGDTVVSISQGGTESHTYTGDPASFTGISGDIIDSLSVDIKPIQAGSGTPAPSNPRAITGRTGLTAYVSATTSTSDATTYTADWTADAGTVYGGTLDVVSGVLTVDTEYITVSEKTWALNNGCFRTGAVSAVAAEVVACSAYKIIPQATALADRDDLSIQCGPTSGNQTRLYIKDESFNGDANAFVAAMGSCQIVFKIAPTTYQLTAQQVAALVGQNYVSSDGGQVSVVVETPPHITNHTLFDAKPILRVYGTGTLGIGASSITISTADTYTDIDCELMDCYKGSTNCNANVTFSSNDFPVLPPGATGFTFDGVTQVDITPRWWTV